MGKRDACDKCHDMKSRCHKNDGCDSCTRCQKYGFQCYFSEALRPGRPKKRTSDTQQQDSAAQESSVTRLKPPSLESALSEGSRSTRELSPLEQPFQDAGGLSSHDIGLFDVSGSFYDLVKMPLGSDYQSQTAWNPDLNLDSLLTATPLNSDFGNICNQSTTMYDSPAAGDANLSPSLKRPRLGPTFTTSATCEIDGGRNGVPSTDLITLGSPLQRLLELQSTLQKISVTSKDGRALDSNSPQPHRTAIEDTFKATEDLITIIQESRVQETDRSLQVQGFGHRVNAHSESNRNASSILGDGSILLLVLSCYVRLLEIYEKHVMSLGDQAEETVSDSGSSLYFDLSTPSSASTNSVPTLSIGQFSLSASPSRNLSLLLHVTQDMIEHLQGAVQLCALMCNEPQETSATRVRTDSYAGKTRLNARRTGNLSRMQNAGTVGAMSDVFNSILVGIESREKELVASIRSAKDGIASTS